MCRAPRQVGIQVSYEDLSSGKHCSICKAYATFVAQGPPGTKVSAAQRAPAPGQRGSHPCSRVLPRTGRPPPSITRAQVKLKPLAPQTEEEKIEHSIAAERRRMRLVHKDTLKDLLTRSPRDTGTVRPPPGRSRGNWGAGSGGSRGAEPPRCPPLSRAGDAGRQRGGAG